MTARIVDDAASWDAVVAELGGHLLQGWRWGAFKSRHGWQPRRLLLSQHGTAVAAAQMLLRTAGPVRIAYVPRGPMGRDLDDPVLAATVTTALDHWARRERAMVLFIEPDRPWSGALRAGSLGWQPSDLEFQPQRTIKVRVDRSDDELLNAMRPKTRYNIRLARRRGVSTRIGTLDDIPRFYRLLTETGQRDKFGIHRVEYYRDVLTTFGDDAALILAEVDGDPAAAIIVVRQGQEAIYLYGASAGRHQRHMPSYLLQFAAMQWARAAGCRVYDLWGIPPKDEPPPDVAEPRDTVNVRAGLWGVYRFKQGFGGEVVSYPGVVERSSLPALVRVWRRFGPGTR
ncbi:MAG: peptidoglycan bridge formation glycyltransferase FemA/FemB family protein [Sphaerobacter sp.]|nr:peptidoglycan bridge formation glycyltransferase FemA/FemB family protein [Sphaerobacter sp.]